MVSCRSIAVIVLLFITLCASASARAQADNRRGFWAEAGSGPSHVRVMSCSRCEDIDRTVGVASYASVGGRVSRKVLLGVEYYSMEGRGRVFATSGEDITAESSSITVVALWYPFRSGTFFRTGVGTSANSYSVHSDEAATVRARTTGVGLTFGVGYDRVLTRHISFTAAAATWITAIGDLILPTSRVDDVIASMYGMTLGITIR
jgi:hypothetical protein